MSQLTTAQKNAINNISPAVLAAGISLGDLIDQVKTDISSGNLGITADAGDVDSLAKGGGHAAQDLDTTSGLVFAWKAFRFYNGYTTVTVAAGTLTLNGSQTNYVEVDRAGTVSFNNSGFTAGRQQLWTVVTGISSITSVTVSKPLVQLIGSRGVTGLMLSDAASQIHLTFDLGDLSATFVKTILLPAIAGTIKSVSFVTKTAVTANDTNYWTWGLVNKGPTGAGSTAIVDAATAANSTKATGGASTVAYVKKQLTLSGTPANLVTAAEDALVLTITKAAAGTTMEQCSLRISLQIDA